MYINLQCYLYACFCAVYEKCNVLSSYQIVLTPPNCTLACSCVCTDMFTGRESLPSTVQQYALQVDPEKLAGTALLASCWADDFETSTDRCHSFDDDIGMCMHVRMCTHT